MTTEIDPDELKNAALALRIRPSLKTALQARATAAERKLADYIDRVLTAHVENTPTPSLKSGRSRK